MMTDVIKFTDVKLPYIDGSFLSHMKRMRFFGGGARDFLQIAFDHGGYIAGGFGIMYGRVALSKDDKSEEREEARLEYFIGHPRRPDNLRYREAERNYSGDIDVWFPNIKSLEGFLSDSRYRKFTSNPAIFVQLTVSGCAIEYIFENSARIQVITKFLMPMHEQLSRFDIYNAMVGITSSTITVPEHWLTLEENQMLHVNHWSPWTINRFFKYINRKQYKQVSPATGEQLGNQIFEAIERVKTENLTPDQILSETKKNKLFNIVTKEGNFVHKCLLPIMSGMTGEQLVAFSSLFKCKDISYDLAMREIRKRMPLA